MSHVALTHTSSLAIAPFPHKGPGPLLAPVIVHEEKGRCNHEARATGEDQAPNGVQVPGDIKAENCHAERHRQPDKKPATARIQPS